MACLGTLYYKEHHRDPEEAQNLDHLNVQNQSTLQIACDGYTHHMTRAAHTDFAIRCRCDLASTTMKARRCASRSSKLLQQICRSPRIREECLGLSRGSPRKPFKGYRGLNNSLSAGSMRTRAPSRQALAPSPRKESYGQRKAWNACADILRKLGLRQ